MVSNPNGPPSFDATLDLKGLNLPQKSKIFVEAYRRSFFKRFASELLKILSPNKVVILETLTQKL